MSYASFTIGSCSIKGHGSVSINTTLSDPADYDHTIHFNPYARERYYVSNDIRFTSIETYPSTTINRNQGLFTNFTCHNLKEASRQRC